MVSNKRAQLTLFIIVGIMIVVAVVASLLLLAKDTGILSSSKNPRINFQSCVEDAVLTTSNKLLAQGGVLNPPHTISHLSHYYTYICYTADYYGRCYNYYPFLEELAENQIIEETEPIVVECFNEIIEDYERKGFSVTQRPLNYSVDVLPGKIELGIQKEITLEDDAGTETFKKFGFSMPTKLYELTQTVQRIITLESQYCYFDISSYMLLYPESNITRRDYTDSKIYQVADRNTQETYKFAVRTCPFAPGV